MKQRLLELLRARPAYFGLVGLPLLVLAIYYGLIGSDRYVSRARLIVERDQGSLPAGLDLGIVSLGKGPSALDVELVKQFIESPAMLEHLDGALQLRAHWSGRGADYFSRLGGDASREDFFKYYLDHIAVSINPDALTLDVDIQAFDEAYSQTLLNSLVQRAEQFVNEVGQGLAREQVRFVDGEVGKAHAAVMRASDALIAYQNENELLSPVLETESVSLVIGSLQQELARQRTELKALQGYLSGAAPEVSNARKRISALERQIEQERSKQVRTGKNAALNDLLVKYKELELTLQVATDIYQTALKSLEGAKLDASRKVKHLVLVSAPSLPEESTRPRRLYAVATWAALLHVLYLVGGLIVTIIKDHRE